MCAAWSAGEAGAPPAAGWCSSPSLSAGGLHISRGVTWGPASQPPDKLGLTCSQGFKRRPSRNGQRRTCAPADAAGALREQGLLLHTCNFHATATAQRRAVRCYPHQLADRTQLGTCSRAVRRVRFVCQRASVLGCVGGCVGYELQVHTPATQSTCNASSSSEKVIFKCCTGHRMPCTQTHALHGLHGWLTSAASVLFISPFLEPHD